MKYGHHDARGNCEFIADELILVEQHLSGKNVRCPECLTKHGQTIRAYATEGMALDNSKEVMPLLQECAAYGDGLVKLITMCAIGEDCKIKSMSDVVKAVSEARGLRKKINTVIYGIPGDLDYDADDAHADHIEPHAHHHHDIEVSEYEHA